MLKVEHREKDDKRIVEVLRDEATGRSFRLVFFTQGAAERDDDLAVMLSGPAGRWHVSECRPNGRFSTKNRKETLDVPASEWGRVQDTPSAAYSCLAAFKAAHPGYDFVMVGGGRGSRSIYYSKREEAIRAVENAILADVWLMDSEPIRRRKLGRDAEISLEDYALLSKAPGQEHIMQALGRVEKVLGAGHKIEVFTHLERFRIEVRQPGLEYPESSRMLVSFSAKGRPDGYCFARQGFYGVADSLMGKRVPRYDQSEGLAIGIPAYGQGFYQSIRPPLGWRLEECLGCQDGASDKIYASVRSPDGRCYVAWGRREGPSLQVKNMGMFKAQEVVRSKLGRYSPIDVSSVPNFWDRVTRAIAKNEPRKN